MRRVLLLVSIVAFAWLPACGDSTDPSAAVDRELDDYVDALEVAAGDDVPEGITAKQLRCVLRAVIDAAGGVDALRDAEVEPSDIDRESSFGDLGIELDDDAADDASEAVLDCDIDFVDMLAAEAKAGGGKVDDDGRACVAANLDEEALARATVAGASDDPDRADADLDALFEACPAFFGFPDEPVDVPDAPGPYVDALVSAFLADENAPFGETEARCIAETAVDIITLERLQAAEVTPAAIVASEADFIELGLDLSVDEGIAIAQSFVDCDVDLVGALVSSYEDEDGHVDPELESCIRESFDEEAFIVAFGKSLTVEVRPNEVPADFRQFFIDLGEECPELNDA